MRIMAHLSKDEALLEALTSGEDLHTTVGAQVFGVKASEVTSEIRRTIKAMSYGLAYGLSAFGLSQQLGIKPVAAKELMNTYFERFGGIRDYLADVVIEARKVGYTDARQIGNALLNLLGSASNHDVSGPSRTFVVEHRAITR